MPPASVIVRRMKPVAFAELARMRVVHLYGTAFRKATGVSLKVVPPDGPGQALSFGPDQNAFCALTASTPAGCAACLEAEVRVTRSAARKLVPQQIHCYAGLTVVAVPVCRFGHLSSNSVDMDAAKEGWRIATELECSFVKWR